MAWRWVATTALAGVCVIPAVWTNLETETAPPTPVTPERQISDAIPAPLPADEPIRSDGNRKAPSLPDNYDTDIAYHESTFGIAELRSLAANGETFVELPGQAQIMLRLERRQSRHDMEILSASHAGLTSTFTLRGDRFFATLATPLESYRMESDGSGSRLYPHRQLAARTIRHEKDFRHVH